MLCQLNSPEQNGAEQQSRGLISVSPKIVKVGSMGAAIFISTETGTPFWTLFGVINAPYNCEVSIKFQLFFLKFYTFLFSIGKISSGLQWFP